MDLFEPGGECVNRLALGRNGGEHDGDCLFTACRVELGPGEQARAAEAGAALQGGDDDDIPFQALGGVDGEQFDEGLAGRDGVRLGVESLQAGGEKGGVDAAGSAQFGFHLVEEFEEAASVDDLFRFEPRIATEGAPRTFHELRRGKAGALRSGGFEHVPDSGEALNGFFVEEMAALGHEALDGLVFERRGVGIGFGFWLGLGAGEGVEVGEREAAPGCAQDGERGDAVGGVEQGAGERG